MPRSCRFVIAYAVAAPVRSATSEPELRERISPAHGSYPSLMWWAMPVPAGVGEELGPEADQAARRHDELHPDPAGAVVGHLLHPALPGGEQLGDRAEVLLGGVDGEPLHRLVHLAVDLLGHHLRLADRQLVALAAHLLDQDREGQLAATLDLPRVGALGGQHGERDVADQLGVEAGP
jgi:hypothetical protein